MRLVSRIATAQLALAMLALMTMGMVTVADVFLKYVLNRPVLGAYDLVESLQPIVVFHGLPATLLRRQNITIDLIDGVAGERRTRFLIGVADVVVLILFGLMTAAMVPAAFQAFDYGDRKVELGLPVALIWAGAILGLAGTVLAASALALLADQARQGSA